MLYASFTGEKHFYKLGIIIILYVDLYSYVKAFPTQCLCSYNNYCALSSLNMLILLLLRFYLDW